MSVTRLIPGFRFRPKSTSIHGAGAIGFTLVELLIVAALLAVLAGALVPRLNGAYRGLQFRGEVHRLTSMIQFATETAVRNRTEIRLRFQQGGDRFWLEGEGLDSQGRERGPFHHPSRNVALRSEAENLDDGRDVVLQFFPDGTRTEALLLIQDPVGRERWIDVGRSFAVLQVTPERPQDEHP